MPAIKEVFEKGVILENIVFLRMFFVAFAHEIGPIEVYAVDGIASRLRPLTLIFVAVKGPKRSAVELR